MIKYNKLPENIEALIPEAVIYLQSRPDVLFAYLFGSLAKGKPLPLSDIDIAVYLAEGAAIHEQKMGILGKLIEILQTDEIDLVILNKSPLTLCMQTLKNKKVIVDKVPFIRHQYESLTMRKYFDFSIKETSILERRFPDG